VPDDLRRKLPDEVVEPLARLTISTCVGCGAMREFESCARVCSERKLELVSGSEYDELTAAAAARRVRIQAFWTVVEEMLGTNPAPGGWQVAHSALQRSARSVLRRYGAAARSALNDPFSSAETVIVWRCPDCGGVDAPQPCIGVCLWRPADWVDAILFESARSRGILELEAERALVGLLGRLGFVTPRDGQWERNWHALQSEARLLSRAGHSPPPGHAPVDVNNAGIGRL
jgi:hypothetical protein